VRCAVVVTRWTGPIALDDESFIPTRVVSGRIEIHGFAQFLEGERPAETCLEEQMSTIHWRTVASLIVIVVVVCGAYAFLTINVSPPGCCPTVVDCLYSFCHGGWPGQSGAVWIEENNAEMVGITETVLAQYLRPGDGIAVLLHNASDFAADNARALQLHQAFPSVILRGMTTLDGGTGSAGGLRTTIGSISPLFSQLSADYENNGPVEFSPNGTAALNYFANFSQLVHGGNPPRYAVGYLSGRGVLGDYSGPPDNWDYGQFASVLNGMTIETQSLCANGTASWDKGVTKIMAEYEKDDLSLATLTLQITVGPGWFENGVSASQAISCANYWRNVGPGNILIWWSPSYLAQVTELLQGIGR
jgi:hypothetical protein